MHVLMMMGIGGGVNERFTFFGDFFVLMRLISYACCVLCVLCDL